MRYRFRWSGCVASAALIILACAVSADEPKSSSLATKQSPDSVTKLTLEEVLSNWQRAQSKIDRLDACFSSIVYDHVFECALIGRGLVSVDRGGRIFFELKPDEVPADQKTIARGSHVYKKVPAPNERWHWTGGSIIKVDDAYRQYERIMISLEDQDLAANPRPAPPPLPEDVSSPKSNGQLAKIRSVSGQSGWPLPLLKPYWIHPFLLEDQPSELRRRYLITLTKQSANEIWLQFEPQFPIDLAQFKKATLILDLGSYTPKALKFEDHSGNKSQVFMYSDVRINQPPTAPFGDLGEPDLQGYKRINHNEPTARRARRR